MWNFKPFPGLKMQSLERYLVSGFSPLFRGDIHCRSFSLRWRKRFLVQKLLLAFLLKIDGLFLFFNVVNEPSPSEGKCEGVVKIDCWPAWHKFMHWEAKSELFFTDSRCTAVIFSCIWIYNFLWRAKRNACWCCWKQSALCSALGIKRTKLNLKRLEKWTK